MKKIVWLFFSLIMSLILVAYAPGKLISSNVALIDSRETVVPISPPSDTATSSAEVADIVFVNGVVYGNPAAEAVAVVKDKISFIGSTADVQQFVGVNSRRVDLEGGLLLPGFVDFHNHFAEDGGTTCFPNSNLNLDQQKPLLTQCGQGVPAGQWIIGYGGSLEVVLDEYNPPNTPTPLEVLDEIFPANPIIIMEHTSHAMFVNSLALNAANITAVTPDPKGGRVMKDEFGQLNGILVDNAGDVVMEIAANSNPQQFDINYDGLIRGMEEVKKVGITTIGDGRTYWGRGMMDVWFDAESRGLLTVRVSVRPWIYPHLAKEDQLPFLASIYQNDISRKIIVNQVKMYVDGVPENGTARVIEPYVWTYFWDTPNGINYLTEAEMVDWLTELRSLGYGAHVHAIGDLGIRETLNAFESLRNSGSDRLYSMTHAFMIDPADIPRFAQIGVDADFQVGETPIPTQAERALDYAPFIGHTRASELYFTPVKQLDGAGANVVLSSDWTVYDLNPLTGISVAVAQGSFGTVEEAIDAYTIRPARALGLDSIIGSIEVGKSADFAILAADITKLSPDQIRSTPLVMTVFAGEIIYPMQQPQSSYTNFLPVLISGG